MSSIIHHLYMRFDYINFILVNIQTRAVAICRKNIH